MKKLNLIIDIIVISLTILMSSCMASLHGTYGTYDENDSYYIYGTPYYHTEHYYNDYYYDNNSQYYQRQHYYRDDMRPTDSKTNVYKGNNRNDRNLNNNDNVRTNHDTNVSKSNAKVSKSNAKVNKSKRSNNQDSRRSKEKELK